MAVLALGAALARPSSAPQHAAALPAFTATTPLTNGAVGWQGHAAGLDLVPTAVLQAARSVTVAVVDTGVDVTVPALAGKVAGTYDVRTAKGAVADQDGHGTFVASLIAGTGAGGVVGFGGAARLLVVKASDSSNFTDLDVAAGIVYAVRHGAQIVNLSIAGRTSSAVEASAIRYAVSHGVLVVAAAGNDALAGNPVEYPAALLNKSGLVVGASDPAGARAAFSESGSSLSLAAPGVSVLGAMTQGLYGLGSGTSLAAPEVAGAAALVWAADRKLTAKQVAGLLEQTASGHGVWTPDLGYGVIDVGAAVDRALQAAAARPRSP
jgi:subtilisin family serine protease